MDNHEQNPIPEAEVVTETLPAHSEVNGNGKRRPEMFWKCYSDGSTRLEVAVWAREMEGRNGPYTQYSVTIGRSWVDQQGAWHDSGKDDNGNARLLSYRGHDIPVLVHLLNLAHAWILSQRTQTPF